MNSVMLKDLPNNMLPRERFLEIGPESLSDEEVLSIILRCGYKDVNVKVLSNSILKEIGSISNLKDMSIKELSNIKGVGSTKAITLLAAIELGKRVLLTNNEKIKLNNPKMIYDKYIKYFKNQKQELFYVIYLDNSKNIIKSEMLFKGTINSSSVHPREIFKGAVKNSASSFVMVHNHPSGELYPSNNDIDFTSTILKLSKLMDIKLIDHIIFTDTNYFSFYENGLLK